MQKITMKALRDFPYAGKRLKRGDVFEVRGSMRPGSDPAVLKAVGHAEVHRAPAVAPTYQTRAMTAQTPSSAGAGAVDLGSMDRDALYALALKLGLKPHHMTGAAKLREAIAKASA